MGVYLASVSSVSSQILAVYMGITLPVIGATFVLAAIAYLLAGDQLAFLRTSFRIPWIGLLVWWGAAAVFGMYPTGSLELVIKYAFRLHILPFMFMGIAKNARAVRVLMSCFAVGYVIVLVFCYRYGRMEYDRFLIPDTALANANDLALHLLLGASFMLIFLHRLSTRALWLIAMPAMAYYVLRTASRANMVTLLVLVVVAVVIVPPRVRVRIGAGILITAIAILPLLPAGTRNRLLTFTSLSQRVESWEQVDRERGAVGSTRARTALQKRAIELTVRNPLLGVGPGMFPNALDELIKRTDKGQKSPWQVSHNSYLQVSSESGIPGLVFYVWCIVLCVRFNYSAYVGGLRAGTTEIALQSFALLMATLVYAVGILFCSIAYDYHLSVIVGFTAANYAAFKALRHNYTPGSTLGAAAGVQHAPVPRFYTWKPRRRPGV